jgi:hypothetical protein
MNAARKEPGWAGINQPSPVWINKSYAALRYGTQGCGSSGEQMHFGTLGLGGP